MIDGEMTVSAAARAAALIVKKRTISSVAETNIAKKHDRSRFLAIVSTSVCDAVLATEGSGRARSVLEPGGDSRRCSLWTGGNLPQEIVDMPDQRRLCLP